MTKAPEPRSLDAESDATDRILLRLFVTGDEENSNTARVNLENFCRIHLENRCQVEVIDILEDFEIALNEKVFVSPTLKVVEPRQATLYGNLADSVALLRILGGG